MAVTFKVPSSPKKDVFEIDNFLGVDLTNTGSNIDEVRSPNAPNMVRYVPGKVRKRTGYKTQVEFSTGTNVNRALGTSEDEQIFEVTNTWSDLYDVAESLHGNTDYYYDFWYCCDGNCSVFICNSIPLTNTEGAWIHVSGITRHTAAGTYGSVQAYSANGCELKIREMSVVLKRDDSYAWRKAPEDYGGIYVNTSTDDPVFGCHTLRTRDKGKNYALNENRVHGTSNEYVTYTSQQKLYDLEETYPKGTRLIVDFDYTSDGEFIIGIAGYAITRQAGSGHITETATFNSNSGIIMFTPSTASSVSIKNFSACFDRNDDYAWAQTYEERGIKVGDRWFFAIYKATNYIWEETYSASDVTTDLELDAVQPVVMPKLVGKKIKCHLKLNTSLTGRTVTKVQFGYMPNVNGTDGTFLPICEKAGNFNGEEISFMLNMDSPTVGGTLKHFLVRFTTTGTGAVTSEASWTDGYIYEIGLRDSYYLPKEIHLYHVGAKLYMQRDDQMVSLISSDMNNNKSQAWQFAAYDANGSRQDYDNLYIVDGRTYWFYDGMAETLSPVYGSGKIPLLTTAKEPQGGGLPYEPFNMLQPGFEEQFYGNGTATSFQLSLNGLDDTRPIVKVRDPINGTWIYTDNFSFYPAEGRLVFPSALPTPPVTGEPNVSITAYKTIQSYKDKINKCSFGTLFGVNGEPDRVFLSGNPDFPNLDFYSEQYMPSYFGDTFYCKLGADDSAIMGYAIVNNYLATFKDTYERAQNVIIREGDLVVKKEEFGGGTFEVSDPAFKTINSLQGAGALSPYTFGYLQTEPLFLTESGIYAITAQDMTGEKYGQNRSFYLDGQLLKEDNLEEACATVFNDMYILAVNSKLYILDGLQATRTDKSEPYATRQYVGFYCTDVPAYTIWSRDKVLWFGTTDGKICRFATDIKDLKSYNDDGKAIYCCWETPDLDGRLFYKNKTFRYFAIRMMKALRTSVALYSQKLGAWTFIKEDASSGVVFDFENIDFELFSFSTDTSEKVVHTKMRVKKVDKARFKVENGKLNEPFGLFDLALEYVESGNYKG